MNHANQSTTSGIRLKKIAHCVGTTLGLSLGVGMIVPAWAQQAPAASATEEIVVSASRIARSGFTAPTPTTTVSAEDFEVRATTSVTNMLYELPSIRPTNTAASSQQTGLTPINLRNLGNNRTLVLLDGRRVVPTNLNGVVDGNILPNALVERVEVVTGGASAAWGSDAVAGVVNFIFKKKVEGFQGNIQYGQSSRRDSKNTSVALSWGSGFGNDRGQFMVAGEYNNQDKSQLMSARGWSNRRTGFTNGTVNGVTVTNVLNDGVTLQLLTDGGVILNQAVTSPLRGIQFGPGGTQQVFTYGTNPTGNFMVGGSGGWYFDRFSWIPTIKRKNLYARATYEFSNDLRGYIEASTMRSDAELVAFPVYTQIARTASITVQRDNAYLPASVRTIMTANNITSFTMGRILNELGNDTFITNNKSDRVVAGLDGNLGSDYQWKAYITSGKTHVDSAIKNHLIASNYVASMDAVVDATGNIVCRATTVTAQFAAAGCVPANPFGAGSLTANVKNYVTGTQSNYYDIKQEAGGVQLQGDPFSTWAGKVSLAGGVEYRKESITGDSDPLSKTVNAANSLGSYQFGNPQPISGSYTVKEWFGETVVPLLANVDLAKSLDLNAAVRNTNYSTSGKVTSSKFGLTYKPIDSLLLRGTKSKDIRAPNLNELFQSGAVLGFAVTDYGKLLANGQPDSYTTITTAVGNKALIPEKTDTKTVGIAWTPTLIAGFKASVDYYSINIKDAIASVTAQNLVNGCYGASGFASTPVFCASIVRDASTGRINNVFTSNINFQSITTKGIDYEVSYRFPVANLVTGASGNLTLRALATNLKSIIQNTGTSAIDRAGEIVGLGSGLGAGNSNPKWRSTYSGTYQNGAWTLFGQARYIGAGKYDVAATPTQIDNNDIPSRTYFDASVQYVVPGTGKAHIQVYGKINNLLDQDPPVTGPGNPNSPPTNFALYDTVGRAFTAGVRFEY